MDRKSYETGWDDCIDYLRDKRTLQQHQTGFGGGFVLLGSLALIIAIGVPVTAWIADFTLYNVHILVWTLGLGICFFIAGYVINKKDQARYKQHEDDLYLKWSQRWNDLGFEGDK